MRIKVSSKTSSEACAMIGSTWQNDERAIETVGAWERTIEVAP